jgi:FixJ family two-component response regulator
MNLTDSKLTVAVVDDDTSMLRALARLVQTAGYEVKTYTSAAAFLDDCLASVINCLVVDIQMPGMDGFELAAALAERGVCFPILFITAHDSPLAREKAAAAHVQDFLVKPFDPKRLLAAISDNLPHGVAQ